VLGFAFLECAQPLVTQRPHIGMSISGGRYDMAAVAVRMVLGSSRAWNSH
jgi:hypothetical protein